MQFLSDDHDTWASLFRGCHTEAFHLETRDTYAVPRESDRLRRFLNNEPPPEEQPSPWRALMEESTSRGVSVRRVRVVTVPHSDYQRWLLSVTHANTRSGEDIRYVPRHLAGQVPPDDWWLLDNGRVAYNLAGANGKPAGLAITTDPQVAQYCATVKQRLWGLGIPHAEYLDSGHATR